MEIRSHFIVRIASLPPGCAIYAASLAIAASVFGGETAKELPPFSEIAKAVAASLAQAEEYRCGDLISRSQAATALEAVKKLGFTPKDTDAVLEKLLDDNDFLVKVLRTPKGTAFMRKIAGMPNGYDRLDRLARMPQGTATVEALARGPGGEKMIEYMTKTPGGKNLGLQLSRTPTGGDFNAPTGRIYTQKALVDCLKREYDARR